MRALLAPGSTNAFKALLEFTGQIELSPVQTASLRSNIYNYHRAQWHGANPPVSIAKSTTRVFLVKPKNTRVFFVKLKNYLD
jgi:hypothetical protein